MRMRRVPFFLSRLLFANKFNEEEEKGKKCEIRTNGKNAKIGAKSTVHSQKQGKRKERKERPSASYRCHVSSNSFKVNNSILNPCAEALFAFITRDKKDD